MSRSETGLDTMKHAKARAEATKREGSQTTNSKLSKKEFRTTLNGVGKHSSCPHFNGTHSASTPHDDLLTVQIKDQRESKAVSFFRIQFRRSRFSPHPYSSVFYLLCTATFLIFDLLTKSGEMRDSKVGSRSGSSRITSMLSRSQV